jgi:hypothetical protein
MGKVKGPIVSDKKPSGQTSRVGRPLYENPDGSYYSEVTVTFPFEGKWLTFPSVDESGNILSEDEVFEYVKKNGPVDPITGETFPVFETLEDAESFARDRSKGLIDFNEGGLVSEDKTLEAFGLTYEEMEKRNRDAADQMLPLPYDIEPRVNVLELPRTEFLSYLDEVVQEDTPRRNFLIREYNKANSLTGGLSTEPEEGRRSVAGSGGFLSKPEGESGLGALSGLRLEPAVGAAGIAQGLEQAITATGRSAQGLMPSEDTALEALNVAGMATAGGIASRGSNALDFDPNQVNIFGGMGSRAPTSRPSAVIRRDDQFRGEGNMPLSYTSGRTPDDFVGQFAIRTTKQDQIDDIIKSGLIRQKVDGYGLKKKSTLYFGLQDTPETKAGIMPGQLTSSQPYALVAKADEAAKYDNKGGIPLDALQHIWTMRDGKMVDILPEVLQANRDFNPTNPREFNEGGLVPEDKTLEAFGMTKEEMEQANQQAADQMLPMPYDIPGEVGPVKEDRFGDTAAWAAKDSWEEAKARFQSRGTEEGIAGAIPKADSSVLNTFAAGLGYAADMGLSGLAASDAAWRYSVGLASELVPGMDKNQEQRFTRDVSSIPEAFAGNVTGVVGGIDRLPDVRQATTGARMVAEDVLDAMPEYDPNRVNIFGGLGSRDPGYDRSGGRLPESVGADGQYRFEIDDSPMVVVGSNIKTYESVPEDLTRLPQDTSKLADVMVHDEFFSQYPELKDISVFFNSSMESNHLGTATTYPGPNGTQKQYLELNPQMLLGEPELLKRVLIHEIQHAVQDREGFTGGTSSISKEVRERAAFEIESPENVEIWNQYTKDLEDFKRPENLVAPLEAAKDFILAYSDKNGIRLRDPNFLDRLKDRFTGREESIVEGNLKVMLNSIELSLDNIKSGYGVNFDHYRGGLDSLYRKLGSIVGKEDKDLFRGIVGFSPDVINPKGWGSDFDAMEYFTEVPLLPDLPAPGTDKLSGIPENLLYSIYRRKRGEVEAENAAIRAEMSLQERFDTNPEDTELTGQGIARSQQWGDPYNSGGSNSSSKSYSYFDEGALKEAANQNDKSREILVDMPIDDFLEAAKKEVSESKLEGTRALVAEGTPFNSIPQLSFKNNGDGTGRVTGHEGRHRAMALREQGETTIPVRLMSEGGTGPSIRWGQQNNPNSPDYVDIIPQSLIAEEGTGSVSMPRLAAQIRQGTNPREFNEGGLAMERQMKTMMAEGGIKDSGMNRDPISGNEIPAGSLAKEVRDDVDAKLSEGEYVVPADVVRYFGVNYFEKLRQKAKAGLEEMDRDGRIGGDPVGAPMGDMNDDLSDEEMFALNEMFKGGMVSGYAPGGDVTANQSQLPANEFQLPPSIFAPAPPTAPVATPTTLYGTSGDVMVLMLPAEQERYNQLISEGYSTKPIEAPTTGGETTTDSNRDRDRSAIPTPQVGNGEGGFNFSLSEDESKALSDDPLAFGKGALGGDRLLSSRTLAGVGALGGLPGMLVGGGVGAVLELQDVAKARAGLIKARAQNLEGTPEFLALEKELKEKENNMNFATKALDKTGLFTGQGYVDSLQDSIGVQTRGAIPTSGIIRNNAGIDTAKAMTPAQVQAGQAKADRGDDRPNTWDGGQVASNQNKPDTNRSETEVASAAQKAADKLGKDLAKGGRATGGLVQRPKKKPVAKK